MYTCLTYLEGFACIRAIYEQQQRQLNSQLAARQQLYHKIPQRANIDPAANAAVARVTRRLLFHLFRPRRSTKPTTYVDAAYCYRPSSMVCRPPSVTVVSPAKTAVPIEMPFGLWSWMGRRNHVLEDGGPEVLRDVAI